MAQIAITIPDAQLPRVITAVCNKFDYTHNSVALETQNQFAKRMLAQSVKQWVKDAELESLAIAANQARIDQEQDVNNNISIT